MSSDTNYSLNRINGKTAVDAHLHLDQYLAEKRERIIDGLEQCGIEAVIAVSMHLASCVENLNLHRLYGNKVRPCFGFHPEQKLPSEEEIEKIFQWIEDHSKEMTAIGEVGLPYYMRKDAESKGVSLDLQPYVRLLDRFVKIALHKDKPIVLHAVYEDADTACDVLERHGATKAHFHWFKGSTTTTDRLIRNGYYISVTPDVLYEEEIRQLVSRYPLQLMMAETDGPWPFEGPFSGKETHPSMVWEAIREIASLKQISVQEAADTLYDNTVRFYNLQC